MWEFTTIICVCFVGGDFDHSVKVNSPGFSQLNTKIITQRSGSPQNSVTSGKLLEKLYLGQTHPPDYSSLSD